MGCADKCHCEGDRSIMRDRWQERSMRQRLARRRARPAYQTPTHVSAVPRLVPTAITAQGSQGSSSITVSSRQYYTSSTSSCAEYHKIQIDQLVVTIMRPWRCRTSKTGDEDNGDRHTLAGTVATKTESPGGTTSLAIN